MDNNLPLHRQEGTTPYRIFQATRLIAQRSPDKLSVRYIAELAGVARTSINYYWTSVEDLYREVFNELVEDVLPNADDAFRAQAVTRVVLDVPYMDPQEGIDAVTNAIVTSYGYAAHQTMVLYEPLLAARFTSDRDRFAMDYDRLAHILSAHMTDLGRYGDTTEYEAITSFVIAALRHVGATVHLVDTSRLVDLDDVLYSFILGVLQGPYSSGTA